MLKNLRHHANLLISSPEEADAYLRSQCEDWGVVLTNNPDFVTFKQETFGIDEARELGLMAVRKAVTSKKIFLITPTRLTLQAQNALLKTFEDPFPNTHFFLAVREESLVVPTLRSRMQSIQVSGKSSTESKEAKEFLSLPIKNRLLFAKKFADQEKNIAIFLDNLLSLLRKDKSAEASVRNVYNVRRLIRDHSLAPRMIIEHLSLVL